MFKKSYLLANEVIQKLRPIRRAHKSGRWVAHDLEERTGGMDVLKGCFAISNLDGGDSCCILH
jgi:hypothetical protein